MSPHPPPDEAALIDDLLAGVPGARERFYRCHAHSVLGWCMRLGCGMVDPQDASQDVFIVALRKLPTFRGEALRPWLYGITRRVLANHRRGVRRKRTWFELLRTQPRTARPPDPQQETEIAQRRARVYRCLAKLSFEQREVLVLCDLEGRTAGEAARWLGIPEGTVYSRLHHARRRFKRAATAAGLGEAPAPVRRKDSM